ncbi:MAG: hypothetical protein ACLPUX_09210, partial [Syntrophobacteraceae bacterium]
AYRLMAINTPAAIARRGSKEWTAGIPSDTVCIRPVRMSQIPSKSIPRFFVSFRFMFFNSSKIMYVDT